MYNRVIYYDNSVRYPKPPNSINSIILLILSLHIVTLASIGDGNFAIFINININVTIATKRKHQLHHFHNTKTLAPKLILKLFHTYFRTCDTFSKRLTFKYPYANLPDTFLDLLWNRTLSAISAPSLFNHLPFNTAIYSWPILLHGHSCHWYLSKL